MAHKSETPEAISHDGLCGSSTSEKDIVKSQFVQVVSDGQKATIWHSLFGNPKVVSCDTLELLEIFSSPRSLGSVLNEYDIGESGEEFIRDLVASYYLVPTDLDERDFLAKRMQKRGESVTDGSMINQIELIMSEECNFRCKFCLHFANLGMSDRINNPEKFMTFETAKRALDAYLEILRRNGKSAAGVNFGGGEPLLVWPVIARVLEYCRLSHGKEFKFKYSINTNASLITPAIARKFREYHIDVISSLDGLENGNDLVRVTRSGAGTFKIIMRGLDNLSKQGCPPPELAITVNEENFPLIDERIIDWAMERKMSHLRIDPDSVNMVGIPVKDIVAMFMRLRKYGLERGVEVTGNWYKPATNLNDSVLDTPVVFCKPLCGNTMCFSPSGRIYGCGYSNTLLGTLQEIESFHDSFGQYHRFVLEHLPGTREMCRGCMIEGQCGGGCEITQEFARASQTSKVEGWCDFYRQITCELLLEQLREIGP